MNKRLFKLTEAQLLEWKQEVVNYLASLLPDSNSMGALALVLMNTLKPHFKLKGHLLLQPDMLMTEAHYLRKGLIKLYSLDAQTGEEKIRFIWAAGSIVVLLEAFRERLVNEVLYIELMEDCELVSISNFCMDNIYEEHTVAYKLTEKIRAAETARKDLQTEILQMVDKKMRYCVCKQKFPEFLVNGVWRLSNKEICSFTGITKSTLIEARQLCPDTVST
ncbi:Crp/Fnr family transcriptional regulator [Pedobacter heparinus]|uniref:Crp/Fnr family transcriptional regulator n=1 Tax=Pedobacter heparinus TaxID=984 RepID=UPI002930F38D|nr:Crp/Fnr family transcriptional regulator [Pedobacter heparinus]